MENLDKLDLDTALAMYFVAEKRTTALLHQAHLLLEQAEVLCSRLANIATMLRVVNQMGGAGAEGEVKE